MCRRHKRVSAISPVTSDSEVNDDSETASTPAPTNNTSDDQASSEPGEDNPNNFVSHGSE